MGEGRGRVTGHSDTHTHAQTGSILGGGDVVGCQGGSICEMMRGIGLGFGLGLVRTRAHKPQIDRGNMRGLRQSSKSTAGRQTREPRSLVW